MYSLLFLGFASFVLSLSLTPIVRNVFRRIGVFDQPDNERKLHTRPIPRVGGIAIALSYALAFGLLLITKLRAGAVIWGAFPLISKLFPAATLIFVTGLLDDLIHLKPWQKLTGQLTAAGVAYFAGVQMLGVGGKHLAPWWSFPATIVWLVACTNALNLIDGMDGLAAGVGLFATITSLLAALMQHNVELAMATLPLAACLLGFLRYNFNPATIFLGDSGSLLVGFLLGCYGVLWSQKSATILGMTAPLIALSIPLLDTAATIARRFLRRQSIFTGDRGHIHHRLLDLGLTPRRAALLLYGICALSALFSLAIANKNYEVPVLLLFCIVTWIGMQRLGYVEFDMAARMLLEGSFRRLLNAQLSLRNLESTLSLAKTPDECWSVLKAAYKGFGFSEIQMTFAGKYYKDGAEEGDRSQNWYLSIPLSDSNYVHLVRPFGGGFQHDIVASFAEMLRGTLEVKLSSLPFNGIGAPPARLRTETSPQRVRAASSGG